MSFLFYSPQPTLYFVEEIIKSSEKGEPDIAVIMDAYEAEDSDNPNVFIPIAIDPNQRFKLIEGNYVQYRIGSGNNNFANGNSDRIAKRNLFRNNSYRSWLSNRLRRDDNSPILASNISVHSFHVNVGHGNCTILVLKSDTSTKVWMVDCSNYDYILRHSYQLNIDECFHYIVTKFMLTDIKIERFFLTHSHFDHYSGVERLIKDKRITASTTFYINMYYSMPSKKYNDMLKKITALKCPVIHPMTSSSRRGVDFWYPEKILVRSTPRVIPSLAYEIEGNVNNSSSVFKLTFGDKSMLFTGDVETKGWDSIKLCPKYLNDVTYFIVSHHGSINGHLRNTCPVKRTITNVGDCVSGDTIPIIMGRDNAYPSMYSSTVLTDLSRNLLFSERDLTGNTKKFLEIDWSTANPLWH